MVTCRFFVQGFCRFGDRCWNEHPTPARQQPAYSDRGGFHNPHHQHGGFHNPQYQGRGGGLLPIPTYNRGGRGGSQGGSYRDESDSRDYGGNQGGGFRGGERGRGSRGGYVEDYGGRGGRGGAGGYQGQRGGWQGSTWKSGSSGGVYTTNKFSALSNTDNTSEMDEVDEVAQLVISIKKDMENWESSGLWYLSCYAPSKERDCITGFIDFSPEEIRLEYYKHRMSNIQEYLDMVSQLKDRWRQRKSELANSRDMLICEVLKKPQVLPAFVTSSQPGFNQTTGPTFGGFPQPASSQSTFSSSPQSLGFGQKGTNSGFSTSTAPAFGMPAFTGSGQGFEVTKSSTSASNFNFAMPATTHPSTMTSQPAIQAANFSFSLPVSGATGAGTTGTGATGAGSSLATAPTKSVSMVVGGLHTPNEELTERDLQQFQSKRFMFTKVPFKPPPLDLLRISI